MSFKEKRLEKARGDFLLVGIGIGAKNQSQIPNIFKFLEDLGFKLTNEEQKKARDVTVLKRDSKKFKAFFGDVLERQKNKESKVEEKLTFRERVVRIQESMNLHTERTLADNLEKQATKEQKGTVSKIIADFEEDSARCMHQSKNYHFQDLAGDPYEVKRILEEIGFNIETEGEAYTDQRGYHEDAIMRVSVTAENYPKVEQIHRERHPELKHFDLNRTRMLEEKIKRLKREAVATNIAMYIAKDFEKRGFFPQIYDLRFRGLGKRFFTWKLSSDLIVEKLKEVGANAWVTAPATSIRVESWPNPDGPPD